MTDEDIRALLDGLPHRFLPPEQDKSILRADVEAIHGVDLEAVRGWVLRVGGGEKQAPRGKFETLRPRGRGVHHIGGEPYYHVPRESLKDPARTK